MSHNRPFLLRCLGFLGWSLLALSCSAKPAQTGGGHVPLGVPIVSPSAGPKAREYLTRGIEALDATQNQLARELFQRALEAFPHWSKAQFYLAVAEDRSGRVGEALVLWEKAMLQDFPFVNAHWQAYELSGASRKKIAELSAKIMPQWQRALSQGVPLISATGAGAKKRLRAGVMDVEQQRFIPAGSDLIAPLAVYLWPQADLMVTVIGAAHRGMPSSLSQVQIQMFTASSASPLGEVVTPPKGFEGSEYLDIASGDDGVFFRAVNNLASSSGKNLVSAWIRLMPRMPLPVSTLRVMAEGTLVLPTQKGSALVSEAGVLRYESDLADWRVSGDYGCRWQDGDYPESHSRYAVQMVSGSNAKGSNANQGDGVVSLRAVADRQALLQIDSATWLLNPESKTLAQQNKLPAGYWLTLPLSPKDCIY